jgi:hypothetical protein
MFSSIRAFLIQGMGYEMNGACLCGVEHENILSPKDHARGREPKPFHGGGFMKMCGAMTADSRREVFLMYRGKFPPEFLIGEGGKGERIT